MKDLKISQSRDFKSWMIEIKRHIQQYQIKAFVKVNTQMLEMYWYLGGQIVEKQKSAKWGSGFLETFSSELIKEFPDIQGFSYRNLRYIRQWYEFYFESVSNWQQVVANLDEEKRDKIWQQAVANLDEEKRDKIWQQAVANLDIFFSVPWGHHLYILSKCKDVEKALFYQQKVVENNWSRSMLLNFLDTNLFEREGKAITNFKKHLTIPNDDLAAQILKDPYNFGFLEMTQPFVERELEESLTKNMTRFLLELGTGFSYVGHQVPLNVGEDTLYADLLFYHLELRCFVVIELKTTRFKPEYIGQLGTYVSAVNHLKKKEIDNPTIGLLICKEKNKVMAQYALESSNQPIGIAEYKLEEIMSEKVKSKLPTIAEIENELSEDL
jgi:predicted nuclease of restriction endonuclease-like (RecB) superfamily